MLTSSNPTVLGNNTIIDLFRYSYTTNENFRININLQIIHLQLNEITNNSHNNEIYTASWSDNMYSYNGFVILHTLNSPALRAGQIITITKIAPKSISSSPDRVFFVPEYSIHSSVQDIKPTILIKDNHSTTVSVWDKTYKPKVNPFDAKGERGSNNKGYTKLSEWSTFSKNFTIWVKVEKKSQIKEFNKSRSGCLFEFIAVDDDGFKMQVLSFDDAAHFFHPIIEDGFTYEIKNGYVRINDRHFGPVKSDYKLVLNKESTVAKKNIIPNRNTPIIDNQIGMIYTTWDTWYTCPVNSIVNVICFVIDEGSIILKNTKSGDLEMRVLIIGDNTGRKIEFTLWKNWTHWDIGKSNVLLVKKVRIGDYGGRNINCIKDTVIIVNPTSRNYQDITSFERSICWAVGNYYKNNKKELDQYIINLKNKHPEHWDRFAKSTEEVEKTSLMNAVTVADGSSSSNTNNNNHHNHNKVFDPNSIVRIQNILYNFESKGASGTNFPGNSYKIKVTPVYINHSEKNYYPACINKDCLKKVILDMSKWSCSRCQKSYDSPLYCFSLSIRVKDCSCEYWWDWFGKSAESLWEITAEEYRAMLLDRDEEKIKALSNRIEHNEFIFTVKPKIHVYNDFSKKKLSVVKVEKIDFEKEKKRLLSNIKEIINTNM